jgi:hypothetical protein
MVRGLMITIAIRMTSGDSLKSPFINHNYNNNEL